MRVIHILDHSLPLQSGYVTRTMGILAAQRALGWQTIQLTTARHNRVEVAEETVEGWQFHRTRRPPPRLGSSSYLREMQATEQNLLRLVTAYDPDILHAHSPVLNGLPVLRVGRRLRVPVVYEARAFWEDVVDSGQCSLVGRLRGTATRLIETHVFRRCDAVVTLCRGMREEILNRGIAPEKVTVVPNAVEIEHFPTERRDEAALRASLGLGGATVLAFIGSFYDYEGLDLLISALPKIRADKPIKLLLLGGGPEEAALRRLAQDLDLTDRVIFAGRVPFGEVNRYYDVADALVFPRKRRRLTDLVTPLKPLEAMAKGRLVVASDVGGHRELIVDGATGFLFPPDSVEALAARLSELMAARGRWGPIEEAGRRYVETERDWRSVGLGYKVVYERLTGVPSPLRSGGSRLADAAGGEL